MWFGALLQAFYDTILIDGAGGIRWEAVRLGSGVQFEHAIGD